ncbi:MAG: IclR family transcriptional regulator [Deltaproteobacteria bacterium]|nr:IclR family transcriptional regulator [Deltaproteobacteria bacterium]
MKQPENSKYKVQSVERTLDILDCFSFQNRELSLSEIVLHTGLNKTTAKRLISNLVTRGYLRQNLQTKTYQLGMRLFELGGIVFSSFSLRRAAANPMNLLQNETGATVLLGVGIDNQLVYIDKREGDGMIRISSDIGWRRPLHYGMLGMVLMASLDAADVRTILAEHPLEAHTPFSITDEDAFSLRLEKIRNQGFVLEKEEAIEGVCGIAAPIKDYSRQIVAALGIALPLDQRRANANMDKIVSLVKATCEAISSDLGYLKI